MVNWIVYTIVKRKNPITGQPEEFVLIKYKFKDGTCIYFVHVITQSNDGKIVYTETNIRVFDMNIELLEQLFPISFEFERMKRRFPQWEFNSYSDALFFAKECAMNKVIYVTDMVDRLYQN
jgi:hypothetical protein